MGGSLGGIGGMLDYGCESDAGTFGASHPRVVGQLHKRGNSEEENSSVGQEATEWRDLTVDNAAWIPWETSLACAHPDLNRDGRGFGEEKPSPGDLPGNGPEKDKL